MKDLSTRAKALYEEELIGLARLRNSGLRTAALVCRTFPPAVLAGLGLRPVRLPFRISTSTDKVGRTLSRQDICPLAMELLDTIQSDCVDVMIGMHTCDMLRRLFQESHRFSSIPVHEMQLPATIGDASLRFFTSQVDRICSDLILNGFSKGYDAKKAEEWYRNTMMAADFLRSRVTAIPPVALQYILHLFRIADPVDLLGKMQKLLDSSDEYKPKSIFLLSGSPVVPGDDAVAETVERMGGALVPVNCTGFQMFPDEIPVNFSQASISKEYFNSMKCVRCRPNARTFEHISSEILLTGAHGLIVKSLTFCDLWFTEKVRMKEKIQVPVLILDTELSQGETERTAVRVEAFIQSLEMNTNE